GPLHLTLHDMLGREVAVLDRADVPAGARTLEIPASLLHGLRPGAFLYRLSIGSQSSAGRLMIE
ncbi:MAG: hypothetical protein WC824_02100, partial [Bacteroidota bacterium]